MVADLGVLTVGVCVVLCVLRAGELGTAAGAFDVIAFCSGAWSWSATYESRMDLLQSSQVFYSGRQAGGKVRPGSAAFRGGQGCRGLGFAAFRGGQGCRG